MHTLMIKDLSANLELDREAMKAVHGGAGRPSHRHEPIERPNHVRCRERRQRLLFSGPTNIQSDNTFTQTASNSNTATNVDAFCLLGHLAAQGARLLTSLIQPIFKRELP